jgi:23S rRNA (adenine2503-C2)-methyltransferase
MPINRRHGLKELLESIDYYYRKTRQRVTYEYILFDGINDTHEEVHRLVKFARRVPCKINIIPFHSITGALPRESAGLLRPSRRMRAIVEELRSARLTVMVRSSAGEDISAACGQLAVRLSRRRRAQVDGWHAVPAIVS